MHFSWESLLSHICNVNEPFQEQEDTVSGFLLMNRSEGGGRLGAV